MKQFQLKKNTAEGGYSLHTPYGYAWCPFTAESSRACGTWCALFRMSDARGGSVAQMCGNDAVILLDKEDSE